MKDFKEKINVFINEYGSRNEGGKKSYTSLDKEFIDHFLGLFFFGPYSECYKKDDEFIERTHFKYVSSNIELEKMINLRVDSLFGMKDLCDQLNRKITVEKKPVFYNFASDLNRNSSVSDQRRYFYFHSLGGDESFLEGAVNLAQIFFLAFKIEGLEPNDYKSMFSSFISDIVELYEFCEDQKITKLEDFIGYDYFVARGALTKSLMHDPKVKALLTETSFVSTFMRICHSVELDKNQFFDFFSVVSPVSELMFEIYKIHADDNDYFEHMKKYLHYIHNVVVRTEKTIDYHEYNLQRERNDRFRKIFSGNVFKTSLVLAGALMPSKDRLVGMLYNLDVFKKLSATSHLDLYYQSIIVKSNFFKLTGELAESDKIQNLMAIEYYVSIVKVPYEISRHVFPRELKGESFTRVNRKHKKVSSNPLLQYLLDTTHHYAKISGAILETDGYFPSRKVWIFLIFSAIWMAMTIYVGLIFIVNFFVLRWLGGVNTDKFYSIILTPLSQFFYVLIYPVNFALYKRRISAILRSKTVFKVAT